jgi:4-amino-4-deoxy-L-arabinose transferase-like glycosyltransferase
MRSGVALGVCAGAVLVGTLLRLQFLHVPLIADEGGYAAIARLWSEGYRLYGNVAWVDRPQGLVLLFRVAGLAGTAEAFRVMAMIAAAVTTCAVAGAAWALAGARSAAIAAVLYAVLAPAPHLEGFTANGELLAGAFAAAACAAAAWWLRLRRPWLLVAAGLAAGAAPLVKQSAIDGVAVLAAAIVLAGRPRGRNLAIGVGATAALPALAIAHAAATGFHAWWWAIAGYRSTTESLVSGDIGQRLSMLVDSIPPALQDIPLLLALAAVGLVAARRGRYLTLPVTWLSAGIVGFLSGGLYHPHYWVQLIPPLALLAGVGAEFLAARRPRVLGAIAVAGLAATLVWSTEIYVTRDPGAVSMMTSSDRELLAAPSVGRALAANTRPGDAVYVIWAIASTYWYADRPPALRYLWYRNVERIPGATQAVRDLFTGPAPPKAVAVYKPPSMLDLTGAISGALAARYRQLPPVDGVSVYVLKP